MTGKLLHLANSCDDARYSAFRERFFYPFKKWLLERYGEFIGYTRQEILKPCWRCDGSGIDPWYYDGDESDYCIKCGGGGVFDRKEFWHRTYTMGRYRFNVPMSRGTKPDIFAREPIFTFHGYVVEHGRRATLGYALLSALVLFALYDLKRFGTAMVFVGHDLKRLLHRWFILYRHERYVRCGVIDDEIPF